MFTLEQLAAELGPEWVVNPLPNKIGTIASVTSNVMLHIRELDWGADKGRAVISQTISSELYSHAQSRPSITVNGSRSIKAIANEIKRRILPQAQEVLTNAIIRKETHTIVDRQIQANMDLISNALNGTARQSTVRPNMLRGNIRKIYFDISCTSDSANLSLLYVPVEIAVKICELLVPKAEAQVP